MDDGSSSRVRLTEVPYIEDMLELYENNKTVKKLALGSSYWKPPNEIMTNIVLDTLSTTDVHRYSSILGLPRLQDILRDKLLRSGLNVDDMTIAITCGANQAFMNAALALCDNNNNSST